jgi:hypothetical protein
MTKEELRDHIAINATADDIRPYRGGKWRSTVFSNWVEYTIPVPEARYAYADAMIAARSKGQTDD